MKQRSWLIFAIGFFVLFTAMSEFVDQKGSVKRVQNNPSIMTEEEREEIAAKGYEFGNWARTDGIQLQDNIVTEIAPNVLAKNYYIVLDTSGSMAEEECVPSGQTKMEVAKQSLAQWIQNISSNDNVALMVFRNQAVEEILPLGQNTSAYKDQLLNVMMREQPNGGTPLGRAIYEAHNALEYQARTQMKYGEYNLVILTDGGATDSKYMKSVTNFIFKNTPIVIHTIGFCIHNNHVLNQPEFAYYVSAMNTEELADSLQGVLAESETFDISGFEHIQ